MPVSPRHNHNIIPRLYCHIFKELIKIGGNDFGRKGKRSVFANSFLSS